MPAFASKMPAGGLVDADGKPNPQAASYLQDMEKQQGKLATDIETFNSLKSDILRNYNTQTGATYSLQTSDSGKVVLFTNSSAVTFTIPALGVTPTATQIMQVDILQYGSGKVTLSPAVGVTIQSKASYKSTGGQYSASTLLNVGTDTWVLFGDIVA